ncbi:MAG TPA: hypothetical protein VEH77_18220 [Roseiarcus sp.]|nr:hypothetical protein [Roseiarcus sp.]
MASSDLVRAAFLRPSLSLDGLWDFEFEGAAARLAEGRTIRSPGIWQTQFPSLRGAHGVGRYRRSLRVPPGWAGRAIVVVLEGVFHETIVRVDEAAVGAHSDGWTPIEVDVTEALKGRKSVLLGVDARLPDDRAGGRFGQSLAGKQDWYGVQGGIWKSARIESRDPVHIRDVAVRTEYDLAAGTVVATGALTQARAARLRMTLSRDGSRVAEAEFAARGAAFEARLTTPDPEAWSPAAPSLYDVALEVLRDGVAVDAIERTVGFRRIEAKDGGLMLNGEPFFLIGALDQDWHPEEECRPPAPEFLEERFRNAKAMGLNALRCHVKIPDRLYFDLADRLGLIVWLDMPYTQFLGSPTRAALAEVFRRTVATHGSHPCLCVWTLFNEGWGIELDDNPDDQRWLIEAFDAAKALVPQSLVVDNSPCFPRNYHLKTDIEDFHLRNGFPHQNEAFAATARAFAARAPFPWSPHGDALRRGDEPLVCSEFGHWGLPHPRDILGKDGREPWWFESGHDWNLGAAYPHGLATRFRDAGLKPIFGDLDGFVDAAQELQFRALKFQIETLRSEPSISGYVITELNDTQWESNGLMDVLNHRRAFADRLAKLQTPRLVVARAERTAIRAGETVDVLIRLAGAGAPPKGARVVWRFADQAGEAALDGDATIRLEGPAVAAIAILALDLEARDAEGRLLSQNALEFCVVPPLKRAPSLFPMDEEAQSALTRIGWPNIAASAAGAERLIATRLTTPAREALIAGRAVALVANADDALVDPARNLPVSDRHNFPQMLLKPREGSPWDGQWMGAFAWRRADGPWATLPGGPMLDEHWIGLLPNHVLTGFPSTAFNGLVDAGMAVGWLHLAAAFVKRSFLGRAWLTVTTFDLTSEKAAANPLAPHLLAAIIGS